MAGLSRTKRRAPPPSLEILPLPNDGDAPSRPRQQPSLPVPPDTAGPLSPLALAKRETPTTRTTGRVSIPKPATTTTLTPPTSPFSPLLVPAFPSTLTRSTTKAPAATTTAAAIQSSSTTKSPTVTVFLSNSGPTLLLTVTAPAQTVTVSSGAARNNITTTTLAGVVGDSVETPFVQTSAAANATARSGADLAQANGAIPAQAIPVLAFLAALAGIALLAVAAIILYRRKRKGRKEFKDEIASAG